MDSGGQHQSNKQRAIERKLRAWLAKKYAPCVAVFATSELNEFMRENACLSPAEFLRPFVEAPGLDGRKIQTLDKGQPFKLLNFRLNVVTSTRSTIATTRTPNTVDSSSTFLT
jgi:hypothetical protein